MFNLLGSGAAAEEVYSILQHYYARIWCRSVPIHTSHLETFNFSKHRFVWTQRSSRWSCQLLNYILSQMYKSSYSQPCDVTWRLHKYKQPFSPVHVKWNPHPIFSPSYFSLSNQSLMSRSIRQQGKQCSRDHFAGKPFQVYLVPSQKITSAAPLFGALSLSNPHPVGS